MIVRIGLALLALNELVVGAWNQFAPESFYCLVALIGVLLVVWSVVQNSHAKSDGNRRDILHGS
ncbi:MAG: hypothetical protein ABJA94_05955 [Rhodoglobus sp.]